MREYGRVSPQFWIGRTGKSLRGKPEAQILALYLMTSPHANMIGVFHCPIAYMAHETGLTIEGASKGLQCLIEADFCTYDEDDEYVFVHQFAAHQVGEELSAADKRCKGIENELSKVPKNQCWQGFCARYAQMYHLRTGRENKVEKQSPFEAPSKPLRSQEQEQEQKEEEGCKHPPAQPPAKAVGQAAPPVSTLPAKPSLPACPVDQLVSLYHQLLPELPRCRLMPDARAKALRRRWRWVLTSRKADGTRRACTEAEGVAWFGTFFDRARASDWLMGRSPRGAGHEGWQCDLDFLLSDKGLKAVVEKTEAVAA